MKEIERQKLYKEILARDPRSDGRFYYGVATTGIYCRPVCPAKPKLQNIHFYKSKAEAETAGYRPCLRCRPDLSPGSPQWRGTAATMSRALHLLEQDGFDGDLGALAEKLGMTDRHLRRLFQEHLGASPVEVSISRRLHLARQLLSQTELSVLDVALASGFGSLRRFNDAFSKVYKTTPRTFRKQIGAGAKALAKNVLRIELPYTAPFDWETLLGFFRSHAIHGVEVVDGESYLRHFQTETGLHSYRVTNRASDSLLQVDLRLAALSELRPTVEKIRAQFDLGHNPHHIEIPPGHPARKILDDIRGVRVAGAFDPFEVAVTVILGQLVSVKQGQQNVRKLVERYGRRIDAPLQEGLTHLFPAPEVLAKADFQGLGFTQMRCAAIRELSKRVASGEIDLRRGCDLASTREKVLSVKGVGPWTVEMIALRCLCDPDSFPSKDLIIHRALQAQGISGDELTPWRAYLTLALWKLNSANGKAVVRKKKTSKGSRLK